MSYATGQPLVWPATPDWSKPVIETLAWLTDLMQARTGPQQARQLRNAPRRGFSFMATVDQDNRRIVDAFRFAVGVQPFLLPIYPDVQWLTATLDAGSTSIACATTGYDFVAGGQALLWLDPTAWELVTIDSLDVDGLTLTAATVADWGIGARLYPVRSARLVEALQESQYSDDASSLDIHIAIDEPCDWTAAWPTVATYRSTPVLEWRGDESNNPTSQYDRMADSVDDDTGTIYYFDAAGKPFRSQSQAFVLIGREEHTAFRALLYSLAGRAAQLWVPDWQAQLNLLADVADDATDISVVWCGYTLWGADLANRRDLRIELYDGTVLYRRVTDSSATDYTSETLTLDSALGLAVTPAQVRQINWLSLCTLATDTVQIEHDTDAEGAALAQLTWQAIDNDV